MTQTRILDTGILGSSVLATAERTSGYGESSSARDASNRAENKRHDVRGVLTEYSGNGAVRVDIRVVQINSIRE